MSNTSVDQRRTTAAVIGDHLAKRQAGELHTGVRESAAQLRHDLGDGVTFAFHTVVVRDDYAYLEWSASDREGRQLTAGVDSFAVRDGRIAFQSVHYSPPEARGWV